LETFLDSSFGVLVKEGSCFICQEENKMNCGKRKLKLNKFMLEYEYFFNPWDDMPLN